MPRGHCTTYIATGEVTTLEHELGDHAVELGVLVTETLLTGTKSTEVLNRLGDDIIVELEVDATGLLCTHTNLATVLIECRDEA